MSCPRLGYRQQANQWLSEHGHVAVVQRAKAGVEVLLRPAGPPMEAFRLAGKNPTERAKSLWASLRARETNSIDVLAVWLAVDARIADDPQPVWSASR